MVRSIGVVQRVCEKGEKLQVISRVCVSAIYWVVTAIAVTGATLQ